ncbi:hypothetical protein IDJ77_01535 [Mucilaginibacter sp. ZT4R22]|uniref:Uncharacterized protein n=1 Tax=Mucilaginibacter pankratovii TaxID=2772110 RepID=A0ABR7WM78_9SPHI|nr:hypothetical protein [Mucilaginibacter pankratovii]MBD1362479.1 hypothetical protein [Mucilaginibacter pankratovii]
MIAALYNKHIYLRIATGMLLIMLIGLKTAAPVFISLKQVDKENTSVTENDGEKKAETSPSFEKEKEFADMNRAMAVHLLWHTQIIHITGYQNNYLATHFLRVASPPPDLYLHPIC